MLLILEILKWILIGWLVLVIIKTIMLYGQLNDIAQCYAQVFEIENSKTLLLNIILIIPVIITVTAPVLFLAEHWRFFFLYSQEELVEYFEELKEYTSDE